MSKIKVKVLSRSNATSREGELCPSSGIIEFADSYSHISALASNGEAVMKVAIVVIPEPVIEKVKEPSPPQSEKKKHKK